MARLPLGLLLLGAFGFGVISSDVALRSENVLVAFIRGPGLIRKPIDRRLCCLGVIGSEACCFGSLGLSFPEVSDSMRLLAL